MRAAGVVLLAPPPRSIDHPQERLRRLDAWTRPAATAAEMDRATGFVLRRIVIDFVCLFVGRLYML